MSNEESGRRARSLTPSSFCSAYLRALVSIPRANIAGAHPYTCALSPPGQSVTRWLNPHPLRPLLILAARARMPSPAPASPPPRPWLCWPWAPPWWRALAAR